MDLITVDFETTYSKDYSLSKMTTEEYIRDPQFQVIGVGIKVNDNAAEWISGTASTILAALNELDWSNAALLSHNTMFDGAILAWRCGIHPKVMFDTLCMSRAHYGVEVSHSLKALVKRLGLPDKGDEVTRAIGKRRKDFTPQELAAYGRYCVLDVDLCYEAFQRLMPSFPKKELRLIDLTLRMFTDPVLEIDREHMVQHLERTQQIKEDLLKAAGVDRKTLMSNPKFAELLRQYGVEPPMKISPTTGKTTYAFAKTDPGLKELQEHDNPHVQTIVEARLGNKSTLEETRTQRFIDIAKRGKLPVPIRYYAAHTGRWGGDDKINMQNLPSRGPNAKVIKKGIMAPPGHVLIDCDSSQIEARMLAWLAEQDDLTEDFRQKRDVYKKMAGRIYNKDAEDVNDFPERFLGKTTILGAGYGMGGPKFQLTVKNMGLEISTEEAYRAINIYREEHPKITALWRAAHQCIEDMTRGDVYEFGRRGVLMPVPEEKAILLPSGLKIFYPKLRGALGEKGTEYSYSSRKGRTYIYGGKCLAGDTEVLTDSGWVQLRSITHNHRIWDGVQWVNHDGLIYQGKKTTTIINGVRMTPDHNILTECGWRCASSSEGLHRAGFWLPDGTEVSGDKRPTLSVDLPLHVRGGGSTGSYRRGEVRPSRWAPFLRMQDWGSEQITRHVAASGILGMAIHAGSVPPTISPSMAQLRSAGHQGMSALGGVIRAFLGGYGADVPVGANAGSGRQQWGLHSRKLSMGYGEDTSGEPSHFTPGGYSQGAQADGYFKIDTELSVEAEPVYDIRNCGPNSRFVVRGSQGPFIVHNCVENVVQALARIVVGEQMIQVAKRYRVAMTVHDSLVCCVREEEVDEARSYIEQCMSTAPGWARGLPVACEAGVAVRYGEC